MGVKIITKLRKMMVTATIGINKGMKETVRGKVTANMTGEIGQKEGVRKEKVSMTEIILTGKNLKA
ncbi:hypothetical protein JCM21531_3216 [Acetivibrio straminisolvens JCM 21531]|uniref:Uncharacterized protein n=1 Tax=Acetivibrio straminisolvens JCM 21531 TaxID=1294263 RepID=W4VA25_9FIRM|nr:hypothetical protein JCM21531_3216 [Acetivibrio straminisolvens JCM 21531]